jgi:ABC-type glutathione transport system ATPase component
LVLQDALAALDPLQRVGDALIECIRAHGPWNRSDARDRAATLLAEVELPAPDEMLRRYPHELSGGQRQRVGIAMALANDPPLLIADEPTSSLDPPLALQIARLLRARCTQRGTALLLISHDLLLVGSVCERLLVLEDGIAVERGEFDAIAAAPQAPATRALLQAAGLWHHDQKAADTLAVMP